MTTRTIAALIAAMAAHGPEALAAHARTLQGPRTRGSTTEKGLSEVPPIPLDDVTGFVAPGAVRPGCTYLRGLDEDRTLGARVGAVPFGELTADELKLVRTREGPHGPELYLDRPPGPLPPEWFVAVVLGPPNEYPGFFEGVVYTWHPGPVMAPLEPGKPPTEWTAVKVHNGA